MTLLDRFTKRANRRLQICVLVTTVMACCVTACGGTTLAVVGTARAAGAFGTMSVDELSAGPFMVELDLEGLPAPGSIDNHRQTYVVWIRSEDGQRVEPAGSLAISPATGRASFRATTTLSRFVVFITDEVSRNAAAPSGMVLLRASYPVDVRIPAAQVLVAEQRPPLERISGYAFR